MYDPSDNDQTMTTSSRALTGCQVLQEQRAGILEGRAYGRYTPSMLIHVVTSALDLEPSDPVTTFAATQLVTVITILRGDNVCEV
jgi:hypothetical protein